MVESTHDVARARAALQAPGSAPDTTLLGAVHHGLLSVAVELPTSTAAAPSVPTATTRNVTTRSITTQGVSARDEGFPQLAVRRRGV